MLSGEDQLVDKSELFDIVKERTLLQDAVPPTEAEHAKAKKGFAAEKKKPGNGKAFGQEINSKWKRFSKRME
jgi:hypothetical protein